jgi:threonine dehydrogenase-like Zn-dependent dehydrogenase
MRLDIGFGKLDCHSPAARMNADSLQMPDAAPMRAAVVISPGVIELQRVARPQPGPGEVRLRVETCGVCASNLPVWEGKPWFTYPLASGALGHEATGRIDAIGERVEGWSVGERVAALSYHAYAEYDLAAADAIVRLPPELDGVTFPGEPLACAMNIFARAGIEPGQTVAIIGIGFLGAVLTQLAAQAGARVIALSRRAYALELARKLGAVETISTGDYERAIERVKELTGGEFCPVTIEAVGKQSALDLAGEITAIRGRLVGAGYHQDGPRQINMQLWNWRGLDVINAHERDPKVYLSGLRAAVEAVRAGRLDPRILCTHEFPLEQLGAALDLTRDRPDGFLKAIIRP